MVFLASFHIADRPPRPYHVSLIPRDTIASSVSWYLHRQSSRHFVVPRQLRHQNRVISQHTLTSSVLFLLLLGFVALTPRPLSLSQATPIEQHHKTHFLQQHSNKISGQQSNTSTENDNNDQTTLQAIVGTNIWPLQQELQSECRR